METAGSIEACSMTGWLAGERNDRTRASCRSVWCKTHETPQSGVSQGDPEGRWDQALRRFQKLAASRPRPSTARELEPGSGVLPVLEMPVLEVPVLETPLLVLL